LNVVLDGTPRQHEPLRDLGIGQAARDQSKYLYLAFGQVRRTTAPNRRRRPMASMTALTASASSRPARASLEAINGTPLSDGSAVWAVFDHAAVRVGTSEDA
jgi:hypothetical protein